MHVSKYNLLSCTLNIFHFYFIYKSSVYSGLDISCRKFSIPCSNLDSLISMVSYFLLANLFFIWCLKHYKHQSISFLELVIGKFKGI